MTDRRSLIEHRAALLDPVAPLPAVETPLVDAIGSVLADDVRAAVALPRFDHAAMDGYAVRSADTPGRLPSVGVLEAGDAPVALAAGTAIRIMTGAPLPDGADAVVALEDVGETVPGAVGPSVDLPRIAPGTHVRRAGEDVAADDVVAPAGSVLGPRAAALCAATGLARVRVHRTPRLVVLTTGSELVPAGIDGAHLSAAGVHDSTAVALVAEARARGFVATHRGPVGDDPEDFLVLLHEAVRAGDLVVTTGGVSAGDRDVVKAALRAHPDFWFGSVAVRPGRPQGHGVLRVEGPGGIRAVPVITLPGTPAATYLTFLAFALPVLERLAGRGRPGGEPSTAELAGPVRRRPDRVALVAGRFVPDGGSDGSSGGGSGRRVAVLPGHVGHSQRLLAAADVILVVPAGEGEIAAGARIEVLDLGPARRITS